MGAFFWYYSGIGIHGIDGIRVLFGTYSVFALFSQFEFFSDSRGPSFLRNVLKPINKFSGRVLSGLKLRGEAEWFKKR